MADPDDPVLRGQFRDRHHRRVAHGTFLRRREGLSDDEEWQRDLRAYRAVLPPDAVFTHLTAARLLGWQLPRAPEHLPIFAATRGTRAPRRPGLICSRLRGEGEPVTVRGLPVDRPAEILLRSARDLSALELVVLVQSAFADHRLVSQGLGEDLDEILASGRPGVRTLRDALVIHNRAEELRNQRRAARPSAATRQRSGPTTSPSSADDAVLLAFLVVMGVTRLHGRAPRGGHSGATSAPAAAAAGAAGATDGPPAPAGPGGPAQSEDRARRGVPWELGLELDTLLEQDLACMRRLDRRLGRPPRLDRLRRWRALVAESLLSETGRERVMNRWHRQMGVVPPPETA